MAITKPSSYYKFQGNVKDSVSSYNGVVSGAVLKTGKIAYAYDFDGSNDYVNTNFALPTNTASYSLSGWFRADSIGSTISRTLFSNLDGSGNGLIVRVNHTDSDGEIHVLADNGSVRDFDTGYSFPLNQWVFVVVTYDSSSNTATLYINGSSYATDSSFPSTSATTTKLYVGNDPNTGRTWDGKISEIGIWSGTVLTSSEVSALYDGGKGVTIHDGDFIDSASLWYGLKTYLPFINTPYDIYGIHNVTITGATLGGSGNENNTYYAFDGTNDNGTIGDGLILESANEDFSFHFKLKTDSDVTTEQYIFVPIGENYGSVQLRILSGNLEVQSNQASAWTAKLSHAISTDTEYFCTVTYSHSTGWVLYINGSGVDTDSTVTDFASQSSTSYLASKGAGDYWGGYIYVAGFWSQTLTSSQASTLYNNGNGYVFVSLKTNLTHYYTFDSDASDSVGSVDGTVSGATNTTGKINNGYLFDGSNDYITIPASATNNLSTGTISLWLKMHDETLDYNIFAKDSANFRAQYSNSNDDVYFKVNGETNIYTDVNVDWTQWHFLVFTWDGETKRIYVDGSEAMNASTTNSSPTSGDLYLGHNSVDTNEILYGTMDEVGIWDRALSSAEVTELYNTGSGLQYPFSEEPSVETVFSVLFFGTNY